jgi:hypothetical protein
MLSKIIFIVTVTLNFDLGHMIPLWKGKSPIYFGVIRSKVKVIITINKKNYRLIIYIDGHILYIQDTCIIDRLTCIACLQHNASYSAGGSNNANKISLKSPLTSLFKFWGH